MDAHQTIATREYAEDQLPIGYLADAAKPVPDISSPSYVFPGTIPAMTPKTIGIESTGEEHLGITVRLNEMGDLEIKRIVQGGLIDKQGTLSFMVKLNPNACFLSFEKSRSSSRWRHNQRT